MKYTETDRDSIVPPFAFFHTVICISWSLKKDTYSTNFLRYIMRRAKDNFFPCIRLVRPFRRVIHKFGRRGFHCPPIERDSITVTFGGVHIFQYPRGPLFYALSHTCTVQRVACTCANNEQILGDNACTYRCVRDTLQCIGSVFSQSIRVYRTVFGDLRTSGTI